MQSYIISYILTANQINISKHSLHRNKLKYYKAIPSPRVCQNQTKRTLCIDKAKDANLLIGSTLQVCSNTYLVRICREKYLHLQPISQKGKHLPLHTR